MVLFKQSFLDLLLNLSDFGNCPSRLLTETSNIYIVIQRVGERETWGFFSKQYYNEGLCIPCRVPGSFSILFLQGASYSLKEDIKLDVQDLPSPH